MESARIPAIYIVAGGIQEILYKKRHIYLKPKYVIYLFV